MRGGAAKSPPEIPPNRQRTNKVGSLFLGVPYVTKSAVFLNIVQTAVDPPYVLNIAERIFFDGFLKKRVNVCRDII